jgi:hypothetical protein
MDLISFAVGADIQAAVFGFNPFGGGKQCALTEFDGIIPVGQGLMGRKILNSFMPCHKYVIKS